MSQEATATTNNENKSCIKLGYRYYAVDQLAYRSDQVGSDALSRFSGVMDCDAGCLRSWSVQSIGGTNLKLVIADRICNSCGKEMDQRPHRDPIKDNGPDVCEAAMKPRYRRQPVSCYDFSEREANRVCTACALVRPSLLLILLVVLISGFWST